MEGGMEERKIKSAASEMYTIVSFRSISQTTYTMHAYDIALLLERGFL